MRVRPGSALWLLRHELTIFWRTTFRRRSALIAFLIFVAFLHAIAVPMALALPDLPAPSPKALLFITTGGMLLAVLGMASTGLIAAVQALYARGDMDLLLSSPLPPRVIIRVRAAAVGVTLLTGGSAAVVPFANVFALIDGPRWIALHVAVLCAALIATSLSLSLALALFRLMGARRTRFAAQIAAGLFGFAFAILPQLPNLLPSGSQLTAMESFRGVIASAPAIDSWIWLPGRLLTDGPTGWLVAILACAAVLAFTTHTLAAPFIASTVKAAGTDSAAPKARDRRPRAFRSGSAIAMIRTKELRLLVRDPWLLTQFLWQIIYVVPLGVMLWNAGGTAASPAWLLLVMISGTLAGGLAWITVAGENAPDLLRAAPLSPLDVRRAKVEAALIPVALALALPLAFAWRIEPWLGIALLLCTAGGALSGALLNVLFFAAPAKRSEFSQRHKANMVVGIAELFLAGGWVLVCYLMLLYNNAWALLLGAALLAAPTLLKALGRPRRWADTKPRLPMLARPVEDLARS